MINTQVIENVTPRASQASEKRKRGRPAKFELWFPRVARAMADGTTLPRALKQNGISLTRKQRKLLYKSRAFQRLYKIERYLHLYKNRSASELEALRKFAQRVF